MLAASPSTPLLVETVQKMASKFRNGERNYQLAGIDVSLYW